MAMAKIRKTLTIAVLAIIGSVCRLSAQTYIRPQAGYYYISNAKFPTRYLTPNQAVYAADQPYLWTDTGKGGDAIWEIMRVSGDYHYIIHTSDGKYILYNGEGAQAVHIATTNNPGNYGQFRFRSVNGNELAIIPRSARNQNSGYNNSFNPYNGETGIIGLYRFDSDQASRWLLERITAIEQPSISVNTNTGQCTLSYQGTIPADIHYTLDGTTPTATSTLYSGTPFAIDPSRQVTIKAIAVSARYNDVKSDVSTYTITVTDINNSNLNTMTADGHYRLTEDITITGNILPTFTGTLDGNYHTISGLTRPLFENVNGGTVKNLIFSNVNISGSSAGAVCGTASGSARIYNCGVLGGSVSASDNAGGLVGTIAANSNVRVVNCYNYATISGGTYAAGIVGRNQGTISGTTTVGTTGVRITNCMMYGDMTSGTNRSPVYGGNHTNNVQKLTEYNYYRSRANLTYTAYNDQLAIDKDEFLTRFPFYRHIQNTHREMAAYFLFGEEPSAAQISEIGHWVLKPDVAPYPIIEPWQTGTRRTTQDIRDNLPATADDYAGKLISSMGNGGYLTVNYTVNGTSGSISLPITDMDTLRYDYTWGKVVLPFANELWTQTDYSKVVTGWKITSVTKNGTTYTTFNIPADEPYNFADRDNPQKDIYDATNNPYIFAQGGNYIVPYGVTAISIEANFATAYYLSDARSDFGYNTSYGGQTSLGWAVPTSYHGRTVYTDLNTLVNALSNSTNPHSQAIVLVGNYHYNQSTIGGVRLNTAKACTIMSVDEDRNQEPDYGWYSYHTTDRSAIPPIRFDFVPNIGMGMAERVTGSTPYPTIGIWHGRGWFELTETCVSFMSECEINDGAFNATDNGHGNNRWIANSGYFIQIVRARSANANRLSYLQIGGNAYVKELYPGSHTDQARVTTLCPILCTGGEIEECYMTGYTARATATGSDIRFWGAGGKIHKWLGAYMESPSTNGVNVTARIDHARIYRFFGGGTSSSARITGNIDITMNNSLVDFYCGGPEFGDMAAGKTVTTHATGSTFGEFYGAGFGGTSITYTRQGNNTSVNFGNDVDFPIAFGTTYKRLTNDSNYGTGSCYKFEFILYAGGSGTGVARSYTGYAQFSLATTGSVTNVLDNCIVKGNFYGAGCQGKVNGTVNSTLTGCTLMDNAFGGGYKATSNTLDVYPATEPTKSRYTKVTGLFSDFGTVRPETFTWQYRSTIGSDDANKILYTNTDMSQLGNVTGAITLTINGGSVAHSVFGGGNESPSNKDVTVIIDNTATIGEHVYGGGNIANVGGATTVSINSGNISGSVYGGGMQANVSGNVTVNISKEETPGSVVIGRDVYGGGALANTNTGNQNGGSFNTVVNLYPGATIGHDVYGGGRGQKADQTTQPVTQAVEAIVYGNVTVYQMGAVLIADYNSEGLATGGRIFGGNNVNGTPKGHILVYVNKTAGNAAQQRSSADARANADATHTYELAAVYGGGNEAEYNPYSNTDFAEVQIDGCNDVSIHSVYGGGNAASTPATKVTIGGAYEIEYVFGGGNGAGTGNPGANVGYHAYGDDHAGITQEDIQYRLDHYKYGTGVATTNIYGGRIHHIYGGSNTRGNVRETAVAMLDEVNACPLVVDGIYGGGREAYMEGKASLEMGCITGMGEIYGGSEKADVGNNVELTLTSGHFGKVFGGNNKGGRIYGSIKVNIEQTGCVPITIDELYLGGNNAPYSVYGYTNQSYTVDIDGESVTHYHLNESGTRLYADPELNIRSFERIGNVYGGGKGEPATMVGNPNIDINVTQGWVNGEYVGEEPAYTQYKQKPGILPADGVIETVYGGGNAADVIGAPAIRIGDKMGSTVTLKSMQSLQNATSDTYIRSGIRIEKVSGNSIKYTATNNSANTITVGVSQTVKGATISGNVYGGGNQANVTGDTNIQVGPAQ